MDFKLKNILIVLLAAFLNNVNAQVKKPTIMILPSDNWCEQRFFMTEFDNQGTKSWNWSQFSQMAMTREWCSFMGV